MNTLIELFKAGYPQSEIALRLGISQASVSRRIKQAKLVRANLNQQISDDTLLENKQLSSVELARKFGVSNQAVHERMVRLGINHSLSEMVVSSADKIRKLHPYLGHFTKLDAIGCYWLGFLYADGCIRCTNRRPNSISISLQKRDRELLIKLAEDLHLSAEIVKEQKKSYRMMLSNIHLAGILCKLGLDPRDNYKLHMPKIAYAIHFIRGLLDGDGGIYIRRLKKCPHRRPFLSIRFAIKDRCFGDELNKVLKELLGFKINGPYPMKSIFLMCATNKKAEKLADLLWSNPIRALARKHKTYLSWRELSLNH